MTDTSTILEIQIKVGELVKDFEDRVTRLYDKYIIDTSVKSTVPELPPFEDLKDDRVRYNCSRVLTNCIDEINDLKLRLSLLQRSLMQYQNFQPTSKTDYVIVSKFREAMKKHVENLEQYRFDLSDLSRNANAKLKTLEAAQYYDLT